MVGVSLWFVGAPRVASKPAGSRPLPIRPGLPIGKIGTLRRMRALRRGLIVLGVALIAGGLMKLRGKGGVPPTSGGWRELEGPDFR